MIFHINVWPSNVCTHGEKHDHTVSKVVNLEALFGDPDASTIPGVNIKEKGRRTETRSIN